MDSFLKKFFPDVYNKETADSSTNQYCKFNSQKLTMFTSSLYLAALTSSIFASTVTRTFGRKLSMLFGGVLFCAGALINGFAQHVWMLILGRILLGFGIGFANQVNKKNPSLSLGFLLTRPVLGFWSTRRSWRTQIYGALNVYLNRNTKHILQEVFLDSE